MANEQQLIETLQTAATALDGSTARLAEKELELAAARELVTTLEAEVAIMQQQVAATQAPAVEEALSNLSAAIVRADAPPAPPLPLEGWAWKTITGATWTPFYGPRWIRCTAAGRSLYKFASTAVDLSITWIGGDPLIGGKKTWQVLDPVAPTPRNAPSPALPPPEVPASMSWQPVAAEGEAFVGQNAKVRFTDGLSSVEQFVPFGARGSCSVGFFNADPAFGKAKRCEMLAPIPTPAPPPSGNDLSVGWAQINNGQTVKGLVDVGLAGKFADARIFDSIGTLIAVPTAMAGVPSGAFAGNTASFLGIDTTKLPNGTHTWIGYGYDAAFGSHKAFAQTGALTITIAN